MIEKIHQHFTAVPIKSIRELADLSMIDIIILQELTRFSTPIKRYILFQRVKDILKKKKKIFTSSFYKRLSDLEEMNFIKSITNEEGKVKTIEPTVHWKETNPIILKYLIDVSQVIVGTGLINTKFIDEVGKELFKNIGVAGFERALVIWYDDIINLEFISVLSKFFKEFYFLAKKEIYDINTKQKMDKWHIRYSEFYDKVIREPNDMVDGSLLPAYRRNPEIFGISRVDLLKEVKRVTKPGGRIILSCTNANYLQIRHFIYDNLIKLYQSWYSEYIFNEQELRKDFEQIGLKEIVIFDYHGILTASGIVP